ncbi:hypothetical protein EMCG_06940 [[Emmonsia] crescens]|uniref:Uncharacterized protein n=1 Tax=[Emmonsia] crescens TaxID=73230 RepID=A0A0G2I9W6_9EURO|nr:hypothetical protein EMCG_06940 [Emmonsia crescens UAMH 3008]
MSSESYYPDTPQRIEFGRFELTTYARFQALAGRIGFVERMESVAGKQTRVSRAGLNKEDLGGVEAEPPPQWSSILIVLPFCFCIVVQKRLRFDGLSLLARN